MTEEWKTVDGFGGHYEASSLGRIRSKNRVVKRKHGKSGKIEAFNYKERLLSPHTDLRFGHQLVHIGVDGKKFSVGVHRLVLMAFVGPCPDGMEGCHNNGDPSDNRPTNLRWDTHYNNNQDRHKHGRYARGEHHPMAKLTQHQVDYVRSMRLTSREIANQLSIGMSQAHRIRVGESW